MPKATERRQRGNSSPSASKDTPGYNKGCLNYGDFIEFFGTPDETLDAIEIRFKQTDWSRYGQRVPAFLYCGSSYRIMRYQDSSWKKAVRFHEV